MSREKNTLAMHKQKSKRRKWILLGTIALIVIIVLFALVKPSEKQQLGNVESTTTDTITKRTLVKSVGATGSVISSQSKDITVSLTGTKVKEVLAKVGDKVTYGSTLVTFDTSDIEDSLSAAQETLSTSVEKNALTQSDASRAITDAQRAKDYQISSAADAVTASNDFMVEAQKDHAAAVDTLSQKKEEKEKAKNRLTETKIAYETAQAAAQAAPEDTTAAATLTAALASYEAAQSAYEGAKTAVTTQEVTVEQLKDAALSANSSYEAAKKAYENTIANQESTVDSAQSSAQAAELSTSTTTQKQQVKNFQKQLEEGVITAPFDGTITALNVEAGDNYTSGTVLTIQDTSTFEIEAYIGQYDISDLVEGQTVIIKTDATGDEEITGKIHFISPVPATIATSSLTSTSTTTTSSDATYQVKITLDQQNERLRLGMSASISIIIEQHKDVLTVPYNAVMTDEEGGNYIEVIEDNQLSQDSDTETTNTRIIPVEVVLESNYYTEISGEGITEGERVNVEESASDEESDMMFQQQGGF